MIDPKTLSYSEEAQGWPSFYSYIPDYMIGMNQYFYSFKNGNLFRHNTNPLRNNYYGQQYNSTITAALNTDPMTIKLFKTMYYESNDAWECTDLVTDLSTGSMLSTYFQQKEGEWFTFIRENSGTVNLKERSVNGVGSASIVSGILANTIIRFPVGLDIGTIMSVGDIVFGVNGGVSTQYGPLLQFGSNPVSTASGTLQQYFMSVDCSGAGSAPAVGDFIFFVKDAVAESHGARGYFMEYTLQNTNTSAVELFAVGSDVMKSFP